MEPTKEAKGQEKEKEKGEAVNEREEMAARENQAKQNLQESIQSAQESLRDARSAFVVVVLPDGNIKTTPIFTGGIADLLAIEEWSRRMFRDIEQRVFGVRTPA